MATVEEYLAKLDKADAAGDEEAIGYFSSKIKELKSDPAPPSPQEGTGQAPEMSPAVREAFASGDVKKAEFLQRQEKQRPMEAPEKPVERIKQFAGEAAERVKFETGRRYDYLREKFTGESKQTEYSRGLPDVGDVWRSNPKYSAYGLERVKGGPSEMMLAAKEGLAPPFNMMGFIDLVDVTAGSDEEKFKMYRSRKDVKMIPDEKGNIVMLFPNGYMSMLNKPGLSGADVAGVGKKALLFGMAGAAAPATATGQAASAMAVQSGMEVGGFLGGGTFDPEEIVLAGIMDGVGTAGMAAVGKLWSKLPPAKKKNIKTWKDLEPLMKEEDFARLKQAKEASEKLDAPGLLGEQVQMANKPFRKQEMERLNVATKDIKDAEKIARKLYDQDVFANKEIRDQLDAIPSGPNAAEDGANRAVAASDTIFRKLDANRKLEAEKYFGEAFKNNNPVNMTGVGDRVLQALGEAIPAGEKEMIQRKVFRMISRENMDGSLVPRATMPPRLAQELKFEIDNLIRKRGETSVGANAEKSLIEVQDILIDAIDDANPGYKVANKKFRDSLSSEEELEKTLIGLVRGTEESKLDKVNNLFNNKDISQIKKLMGQLSVEDPAAPYALYKGWLGDKVESIRDIEGSSNASKDLWNKLFADPKTAKRVFELAPSPTIRQNLSTLRDYLMYSKEIQISGSRESRDILQAGAKSAEQSLVVGAPAAALRKAGGILEKRRADAATRAVLNPRWAEDMKNLRGLKGRRLAEEFEALMRVVSKTATAGQAQEDILTPSQAEISQKQFNIK